MTERGLRRGNWSVQELERLRLLLPRRGVKGTATLLRRSSACIYRKALEIMRGTPRRGGWHERDDALLRDAWGVVDDRLLATMLGRPVVQVTNRAEGLRKELRTGRWEAAERHRLKEFYGTRSDLDLEVCMLRSRDEISAMARDLCLAKDKSFAAATRRRAGADQTASRLSSMPRWSAGEVDVLKSIYADSDNLDVARRLGRTVAGVANKANQLGLRKSPDFLANTGRVNVNSRYVGDENGDVSAH